ncbi:MAG: amino acid lyase [marine bacterium B5-7]|nr:MAG: amino acid lyase [marine bacterium B5-7]
MTTLDYLFFDDYSEGAHPRILAALSRTNFQQERGYGMDSFAIEVAQYIKEQIGKPDAQIHFVSNGTQTNLICLSSMLRSYESVIAVDSGHISIHEAGAIEATGHKVNAVPGIDGKILPATIQEIIETHHDELTVKPRVVYISQATERGTLYSKKELQALHEVCKQNGLYLYLDGARIGNALMARDTDLTLRDIANVCDMFYIGGTKNGALMGEIIVIVNPNLQENFRHHLRQRGALLAKSRVITVQFAELFKDDLYWENAKHANDMAQKLADGIKASGCAFLSEPIVNQVFPILSNTAIEKLKKKYGFYTWSKISSDPSHSVVRLVTSWATTDAAVDGFVTALRESI